MAASDQGRVDPLPTFVRTHHVRYHVWPGVRHTAPDSLTEAGYGIELAADAPRESEHAAPGCVRCQEVYEGLRRLARAILPPSDRESRYDIGPFDAAWHGRSSPEVILTIAVLHRGNGNEPAGACQRRCVAEMKENPRALGAMESSLVMS